MRNPVAQGGRVARIGKLVSDQHQLITAASLSQTPPPYAAGGVAFLLPKQAADKADEAEISGADLREVIAEILKETPESSWDEIVFRLAGETCEEEDAP